MRLFLLLAVLLVPGSSRSEGGASVEFAAQTDTTGRFNPSVDSTRISADASLPSPEPYFRFVVRRHLEAYGDPQPLDFSPRRILLIHPVQLQVPTRYLPPTRFQSGVLGADQGAFAGVALGFLGMEAGLWEERTAWYLMGAGAALGAIWGSTVGSENATIRVRIEPDR